MNDETPMSQTERILEEIAQMRKQVDKIHLVLVGDPMQGISGALDKIQTHQDEIFGCQEQQREGIKENIQRIKRRVYSLESDRRKVVAYSTAISVLIGAVGFVLKYLWPHL